LLVGTARVARVSIIAAVGIHERFPVLV
jgi:hypothetical protein